MSSHPRIEAHPTIMLGKPVISGTRVTVELLLRKLSEGATPEDIQDMYPGILPSDVHAAMAYAADVVAHEDVDYVDYPALAVK